MTRRSVAVVVLLSFITCGIYWFWWIYATTDELKRVTGHPDLNPVVDLVLCIVTCSLWGIYVEYRNAAVVHQEMVKAGRNHEDRSIIILVLNLATFVVGLTGFVAIALLQEELNKLADVPVAAP